MVKRVFRGFFRVPDRLQIAALCYRMVDGELRLLLVTSRSTRRWILPKGWPILKRKGHRTAQIEAYEEAGVVGKAAKRPYASFRSHKGQKTGWKMKTRVLVYLLEVRELLNEFPEAGERDLRWVTPEQAIELADEEGLKPIIQRFSEEMRRKFAD